MLVQKKLTVAKGILKSADETYNIYLNPDRTKSDNDKELMIRHSEMNATGETKSIKPKKEEEKNLFHSQHNKNSKC